MSCARQVLGPAPILVAVAGLLVLLGVPPPGAAGTPGLADATESVLALPPIDSVALLRRDDERALAGRPGPLRFAEPIDVFASPGTDGSWETLADGSRAWRLVVEVPGATDLNFGFRRCDLPQGATLIVAPAEGPGGLAPYVRGDGAAGQLWTGIVPGPRAVLTLALPAGAPDPLLELSQIGAGYRDILRALDPQRAFSGACNNDVACPEGDPWRDEIRSAVRYAIFGTDLCSGSLVVDVPRSWRPFVLTANHCGVDSGNAPTIVTYWNYQASTCGGPRDGAANAVTQTGATFRAAWRASDVALFELSSAPVAGSNAFWSGWDRSDVAPASSVAIHHPSGDEKAITFDQDPLTKGDNCIGPETDTHWWVGAYEDGTTEPGSSGSGIWDAASHLLVGTLSGGGASCTNLTYDCWGRLARGWDAGTTPAQRLQDWLDPAGTGALEAPGGDPGSPASEIRLESVALSDACALGLGDGNGVAEPGETLTLVPTLRAYGLPFTSVTGILATGAGGVSLDDAAAAWPDLAVGAPAPSGAPHLRLTLATDVACGTVIDFVLSVSAVEGGPFDLPFSITVGEPDDVPAPLPLPIPDLGVAASSLIVTRDVVLTGLAVRLAVTHPYVGDLRFQLESPMGTRVTFFDRPGDPAVAGGCPDDDFDITFDDASSVDVETHCAGTTPWYQGDAMPTNPLAAFIGQRTAGRWRVIGSDRAAGDLGQIDDWELITTPSIAARCQACESCPGQPIAVAAPDLVRVAKGAPGSAEAGQMILSYPGARSACADGVQVRMSGTARPASGIGAFPSDPPFADVTPQDADAGPLFRHAPPGTQYYLVVEDLAGSPGPSGAYGF